MKVYLNITEIYSDKEERKAEQIKQIIDIILDCKPGIAVEMESEFEYEGEG